MTMTDQLIGKQLGDYTIVDLLGRGGMARVYRGYDAKLERYAAVKVIDAHLSTENEEEYRQRFLREARAIARLKHPAIVGIYQFGEFESLYYMAMAFIDGQDLGMILKDHAHKNTIMPLADVLKIMRDIASALDYAHSENVIHRDVKPSNIMVTSDGHAVLTDFGLALNTQEGTIGNTFGSAHYIAPEQAISSAQAVPQSDLYSLGVVLYQTLVGKVPFDDPSAMSVALKHLSDTPPSPRLFNPRLSPELEKVVLRALEKETSDRYPNGAALIKALEKAVTHGGLSTPSLAQPPRSNVQPLGTSPTASALHKSRLNPPGSRSQAFPPAPMTTNSSEGQSRLTVLIAVGVVALLLSGIVFILTSGGVTPPTPTTSAVVLNGTEDATENAVAGVTTEEATSTRRPASATPRPAATQPAVAVVTDEATTETTEVAAAEASPTRRPTQTPTNTDTPTDEPTATHTPTDVPTATLSPTETPSPTATERVSPFNREPTVMLYYDDRTMVMHNQSARVINASNLLFVRTDEDGDEISFSSNQWAEVRSLQPGNCFQVWTDSFAVMAAPNLCTEQQSWRAVSFARWFWLSNTPGATFEVRRNNQILATCEIDAEECALDIGGLS